MPKREEESLPVGFKGASPDGTLPSRPVLSFWYLPIVSGEQAFSTWAFWGTLQIQTIAVRAAIRELSVKLSGPPGPSLKVISREGGDQFLYSLPTEYADQCIKHPPSPTHPFSPLWCSKVFLTWPAWLNFSLRKRNWGERNRRLCNICPDNFLTKHVSWCPVSGLALFSGSYYLCCLSPNFQFSTCLPWRSPNGRVLRDRWG